MPTCNSLVKVLTPRRSKSVLPGIKSPTLLSHSASLECTQVSLALRGPSESAFEPTRARRAPLEASLIQAICSQAITAPRGAGQAPAEDGAESARERPRAGGGAGRAGPGSMRPHRAQDGPGRSRTGTRTAPHALRPTWPELSRSGQVAWCPGRVGRVALSRGAVARDIATRSKRRRGWRRLARREAVGTDSAGRREGSWPLCPDGKLGRAGRAGRGARGHWLVLL